MTRPSYDDLISGARSRDDLLALAFAGVISRSLAADRSPLIRGLSESRFKRLLNEYFPEFEIPNGQPEGRRQLDDQFAALVNLLLDNRVAPTEQRAWLSYAIAASALGPDPLWEDMGLPSREVLSELMRENFPTLAALNVHDLPWKKFLRRQLCGRAPGKGLPEPHHCDDCADYPCPSDQASSAPFLER